jgi:hypothetical protein
LTIGKYKGKEIRRENVIEAKNMYKIIQVINGLSLSFISHALLLNSKL